MAAQVSTRSSKSASVCAMWKRSSPRCKENLDQILGNLQDGILLFTGDGRAVLVSEAARRFLQMDRDRFWPARARDLRPRRRCWAARCARHSSRRHPGARKKSSPNGRRIQASLDFIYDDETRQGLGALVTLHDLESAEAIESELELSRRMAAIGRLTSGVGHEVKNPINAIVVHLELLKNKLAAAGAPATRHLEVIEAEIHRLDRVVQRWWISAARWSCSCGNRTCAA